MKFLRITDFLQKYLHNWKIYATFAAEKVLDKPQKSPDKVLITTRNTTDKMELRVLNSPVKV